MAKTKQRKKLRPVKPLIKDAKSIDFNFDYKAYEDLAKFMTDRAKIIGRRRSGLTAKQQRSLTKSVKHARHLGLLPYTQDI